MATWKSRFEDIAAEIEDKMSPSEIRKSFLNKTLGLQLFEELTALKDRFEAGAISHEEYHIGLDELEDKLKEAKEHINKVDFHEDV